MPAKLPLPRKFFTCPELDVDSASMLADHAVNGLKTMVELARFQGGPITWTLESDKDGIQNYSGSGTHAPVGAVLTLHVTNVEGTLEDAASLMQSTNPADYTAYCAAFAPDVSDSATLYTLRTPSAAKPREYAAVKWQCFESPTSLVKSRDVCYVEAQQDVTLHHGVKGWARCMQSIDLPCCPNLQDSHDLVRGWLHYGGYLFTETTIPGEMQIIHVQCMDFKGHLPQFLVKLSSKARMKTLARLHRHFAQAAVSFYRAPLKSTRRRKCMLCTVGPQLTCSKCLQGVCMNCNKYWKMTTPEGRKTRVCYACSSAQATGFRGAKSDVLVDDSLFDSMSGSDHLELGLDRDGSVGLDKDGTIRFLAPRGAGFTSPFDLEGRQSYHSAGSHHSKA
ncbi:hypothetical protein DYB37_005783 [Aphanomyces astaci]|uniref:START domain-containing protein n=1 Tax=Aphanomyces astaci TaxID=112090 RepID=A0A3R7BDF7_APHAT|nr:hypothetical protein DYB37_005783 [Aphanomyces astaci]